MSTASQRNLLKCINLLKGESEGTNHTQTHQHEAVGSGDTLLLQKELIQEAGCPQVVVMPSFESRLKELTLAVEGNRSILVEGPGGSGKSVLVQTLLSDRRKTSECVTVFMSEQVDSKALVGTFLCTNTPGEFIWTPGVLAKAVLDKKWVFIEDIDRSPPDVVSLLLPLVKYGTLLLPGYDEPLRTEDSFRMIATRRMSSSGLSISPSSRLFETLAGKLVKVRLNAMDLDDFTQITQSKFPELINLIPKLLQLKEDLCLEPRLFFKLCTRLNPMVTSGRVTCIDDVILECLDVCFGQESTVKKEQSVVAVTEVFQNISIQKAKYLCQSHKPLIHLTETAVAVGRAYLPTSTSDGSNLRAVERLTFAHTQESLSLLERVSRCVQMNEPVLLVGETGVGKTAAVNYLATATGHKLVVVNMSQQSDSSDLLGGFKPVDMGHLVSPLRERFEFLFRKSFSVKHNKEFLGQIQDQYNKKQWKVLLKVMVHCAKEALKKGAGKAGQFVDEWQELLSKMTKIYYQLCKGEAGSMAFAFVEGALVQAMQEGWWILLDEINLATPETLQCLSSLLEGPKGTFLLVDRGDGEKVKRSAEFRVFGCMNPATDHGKTPLPPHIRNRFTEFYIEEMKSTEDLRQLILSYFPGIDLSNTLADGTIRFYREMKQLADSRLTDGTGRKPHYSLRTLCRGLQFSVAVHHSHLGRALYEGLCMSFMSQVARDHHSVVTALCQKHLKLASDALKAPLLQPTGARHTQVEGYWLPVGGEEQRVSDKYILTQSVRDNLRNLARIISASRFPVLLQGPTSSGKTSLVKWLADATGHRCVRINNHEHTDIQEYIGMYTADHTGKLVFKEGVLVEAMRQGHWVILDELNLAPTEVLEALNRVLDDNRELFITETQTVVKAHSHFMVFGTQNPPGSYGGRKFLSRAFRNRFIELHFEEIPPTELIIILHSQSGVPESYAKKMVAVMQELQRQRSSVGVFAGKHGLITLRDLFKWAGRYALTEGQDRFNDWEQTLAEDGYLILAGRARNSEDEAAILNVLKTHFKRTVHPEALFGWENGVSDSLVSGPILSSLCERVLPQFEHVVWTREMKRMAVLVGRAAQFKEPILLIGETGCGKTTVCQLLCSMMEKKLFTVNCHMYTEASDFLGGLRPVRRRSDGEDETETGHQKLFEWQDGALVHAMSAGAGLLVDEISLAEDAVLERLNSVLEPERKVLVAERGSELDGAYEVVAEEGFVLFATMNPGGDYGKRELSPALRNRFTEVWCSSGATLESLQLVAAHNLLAEVKAEGVPWDEMMTAFLGWLQKRGKNFKLVISTRDLMSWILFFNRTVAERTLSPAQAFYHGACLVFMDSLQTDSKLHAAFQQAMMEELKSILLRWDQDLEEPPVDPTRPVKENKMETEKQDLFGIHPFYLPFGSRLIDDHMPYSLEAPGPRSNALRLLRALQIHKPLLLEGPPGVGKTTLVAAMARASGHNMTRICLSEQTDLSELFGCDLPDETSSSVRFTWRDGPFLRAMKQGEWIMLDEMNLASQSVLEGLNACLDHRSEVYVPALDLTFTVSKETRIFACQNPVAQGGGRKQLPKSFLNRFSRVYMKSLTSKDLLTIAHSLHPTLSTGLIRRMIRFNRKVASAVDTEKMWEFNLRDVLRWCELMVQHQEKESLDPGQFVGMLYLQRMRSDSKRKKIVQLFEEMFPPEEFPPPHILSPGAIHVTTAAVSVSRISVQRSNHFFNSCQQDFQILPFQFPYLESMLTCVKMNWMAILVGPAGSGKSSLVHLLAQLCGHKVVEFPVNSAMDTTDLVGGFVQMNVSRHAANLATKVRDVVMETMVHVMKSTCGVAADAATVEVQEEVKYFGDVLEKMEMARCALMNSGTVLSEESTQSLRQVLLEGLSLVQSCAAQVEVVPAELLRRASALQCSLESWSVHAGTQFEWVDSPLVSALREGHWLIVSNANFCSPSVLDRLNALLEVGGVLTLDERGVIGEDIPIVKPHPNFRLFLTMDPNYGELSHAMRNRGIELYIHPSGVQTDTKTVTPSSQEPRTGVQSALALCQSVASSVNCWSLGPLTAQAQLHLLPVVEVLAATEVESGVTALQELSCQVEVFADGSLSSDNNLREDMLLLLSKEVAPFVSPTLMEGVAYLKELKLSIARIPIQDGFREASLELIDPRTHPFVHHRLQAAMPKVTNAYYRRTTLSKVVAKLCSLTQRLQDMSSTSTLAYSQLSMLQLSRAAASGAISTAVLPIRNIIQLHDMLVNVLTLVKHTCDRLLSEHHWEEFVGEEEWPTICPWLEQVLTVSANGGSSLWTHVMVAWGKMWQRVHQFATSILGHKELKRAPHWGILTSFSCEMEKSLSGARLWLGLWGAFGFSRMRIVKEVEQCLLSIHTVDSKVRHLSPVIHSSSSDSPLLSREAAAAISSGLTTALSDLWLVMLGADSVTVEGVFRQLKEVEDTLQAAEALCAQQSPSGAGRNEALPSLPLVSCHTDLVLKRILRTWLEGDTTGRVGLSQKLNAYLTGSTLPIEVKAIVRMMAQKCDVHLHDNHLFLLLLWQSHAKTCTIELDERCSEMATVSHGLFQWLSGEKASWGDPVHGEDRGREDRGAVRHPTIEVTIGNMECVERDLVQLQQQLWDAAFSGCLRPQVQYLSEYHLQVHLYKWILRSVLKITSDAHIVLLSEQQAQSFLTLQTSPSELVAVPQQEHGTYLGPLASVVELLTCCFGAIHVLTNEPDYSEQCYHSNNIDKDISCLGTLCIYNGLSLATLLAPSHSTSPFEVARAECRVLQGFVGILEGKLAAYEHHLRTTSGGPGWELPLDSSSQWLPQIVKELQQSVKHAKDLLREKGSGEENSEPSVEEDWEREMYGALSMRCQQLMASLCSSDRVLSLLRGLQSDDPAHLAAAEGWVTSLRSALEAISTECITCMDVMLPWKLGLLQVAEGVMMMTTSLRRRISRKALLSSPLSLLCPMWDNPMCSFSQQQVMQAVHAARQTNSLSLKKRMLFAAVRLTGEHIWWLQAVPPQWSNHVASLFQEIVAMWQLMEERRREREQEEEALFKYKEKVHEVSEEEEADVQRKLFPSFDSDFESANPMDEDEMEAEARTDSSNITADTSSVCTQLCPEEMAGLVLVHSQMCEVEVTLPLKLNASGHFEDLYATAAQMMNDVKPALSFVSCVDDALLAAHLKRTTKWLQKCGCQGDGVARDQTRHVPLDVYHDPAPKELERARNVLLTVISGAKNYLKDWPEHPVLNQIVKSCQHVLSLPVTAPLMKVLAGVEYVLKQTQEWEQYASSQVSLSGEMQQLVELILRWRKLELGCWEVLLQTQRDEVNANSTKWWFHVYQTLSSSDPSDEEVTKVLQTFLQTSTLGDFSLRVHLLRAFCHTPWIPGCSKLKPELWNLSQFYLQFMTQVEAEIQKQGEPLEKEFKEYLSLLRWNDGNYWALKDAIRRNHAAVAKLVKNFKDVLSQPVLPLLSTASVPLDLKAQSLKDVCLDVVHSLSHRREEEKEQSIGRIGIILDLPPLVLPVGSGSQAELPHLHTQLVTHSNHLLNNSPHTNLLCHLADAADDVLSQMEAVQMEVDLSGVAKEKRKSQVKLHLQTKKRTLADVFKFLGQAGFSYKKGSKAVGHFVTHFIHSAVVACPPSLSDGAGLADLVESSNNLFYSTAARVVALHSALTAPAKDLTVGDVDRIEGITGALVSLVEQQRAALAVSLQQVAHLRCIQQEVTGGTAAPRQTAQCGHSQEVLFVGMDTSKHERGRVLCLLEQCSEVVQELTELISTAPCTMKEKCTLLLPEEFPAFLAGEGSKELLQSAVEELRSLLPDIRSTFQHVVGHSEDDVLYGISPAEPLLHGIEKGCHVVSHTVGQIQSLLDHLLSPPPPSLGPFSHSVASLRSMSQTVSSLLSLQEELLSSTPSSSESTSEVETAVVKVVESVLLGVQDTIRARTASSSRVEQIEEDRGVDPSMLSSGCHAPLAYLQSLKGEKVLASVRTFSECVGMQNKKVCKVPSSLMSAVVAFLGPYTALLEDSVRAVLSSHIIAGKFLLVLVGMFLKLVKKGFDLPDVEESEDHGEGATEFVDIEGGGFDEGQGNENVSKDNEDLKEQLENATKAPDESPTDQEEGGKDHKDDAIEMDFDFEGQVEDIEQDNEEDPGKDEEAGPEEELTEKMGDLGNDLGEELDKNIWDPEEEDKPEELQEVADASVQGADTNEDPEVVAKETNKLSSEEQTEADKTSERAEALPDDLEVEEEGEGEEEGEETQGSPEQDVENDVESQTMQEDPEVAEEEDTTAGGPEEEEERGEAEDSGAEEVDNARPPSVVEEREAPQEVEDEPPHNQDAVPSDDMNAHVPADQVQDIQSTPNTQMDASSADAQSSGVSSQEHGSYDSSGTAGVTVTKEQSSSEEGGQKKRDKKHSKPSPERAPVPANLVPLAKRLKLAEEAAADNSNPPPQADQLPKSSDLYSHVMEEEEVWDELAIDAALPDQPHGAVPMKEEEGGIGEDEEEMEVEGWDKDGEQKKAGRDKMESIVAAPKGDSDDQILPVETPDQESDKSETQSDMEELVMETDVPQLSSYSLDTSQYLGLTRGRAVQDADTIRKMVEESTALLHSTGQETSVDATELWSQYEALTAELAQSLYESIHITFEPTLATQFKGDFRSGKRLNIRRLIPYIASHYQNDRIWLRRSKPSKMDYQIMVAIDDSCSMAENKCKMTAFKGLAALSGALARLEGVNFGISRFGADVDVLKHFGEYMSTENGGFVLQNLKFDQKRTNFVKLLRHSIALFAEGQRQSVHRASRCSHQLLIVLSDGRGVFMDGALAIEKAVRDLSEAGIFVVFIILDPLQKDSVMSIRIPVFHQGKEPTFKPYLEAFPFPYYIILKDIESLPAVLGESLQQWFQLINDALRT